MLLEVDPQHPGKTDRPAAGSLGHGVAGLDRGDQGRIVALVGLDFTESAPPGPRRITAWK